MPTRDARRVRTRAQPRRTARGVHVLRRAGRVPRAPRHRVRARPHRRRRRRAEHTSLRRAWCRRAASLRGARAARRDARERDRRGRDDRSSSTPPGRGSMRCCAGSDARAPRRAHRRHEGQPSRRRVAGRAASTRSSRRRRATAGRSSSCRGTATRSSARRTSATTATRRRRAARPRSCAICSTRRTGCFRRRRWRASTCCTRTRGVRPLPYTPRADESTITRSHFVIDHVKRGGPNGLLSIVGGKLTTYRSLSRLALPAIAQARAPSGERGDGSRRPEAGRRSAGATATSRIRWRCTAHARGEVRGADRRRRVARRARSASTTRRCSRRSRTPSSASTPSTLADVLLRRLPCRLEQVPRAGRRRAGGARDGGAPRVGRRRAWRRRSRRTSGRCARRWCRWRDRRRDRATVDATRLGRLRCARIR